MAMSDDQGMLARAAFAAVFILFLICLSNKNEGQPVTTLEKERCYDDKPYNLLDDWNTFSLEQPWFKDLLLIIDDFGFDVTIVSALYLYQADGFNAASFFIALGLNSGCKSFVQDNWLTFRQAFGANWYFPGIYSMIVTWHDMNDIYYSGHISNGIIFTYYTFLLWKRHPDSKFAKFWFFYHVFCRMPYTWVIMTILRTHYIIDDFTGLGCGLFFAYFAEKLSYIVEALILGMRARKRELYWHKACPRCGWSNQNPLIQMDFSEKIAQA